MLQALTDRKFEMKNLSIFLLIFISACATQSKTAPVQTQTNTVTSASNYKFDYVRRLLPSQKEPKNVIEVFYTYPIDDSKTPILPKKIPLLLFIHGHQYAGGWKEPDAGGYEVSPSRAKGIAQNGWVVASISQPGYGASTGPADFCGPRTQMSVNQVLDFLKSLPFVDPDKIALVGVSRGASVAGKVAAQRNDISSLVLISGFYEFSKNWNSSPAEIKKNMIAEIGSVNKKEEKARDVVFTAKKIKASTLLVHGEKDPVCPFSSAQKLETILRESGTKVTSLYFTDKDHETIRWVDQRVIDFIKSTFN
jgi:dipeptidyl aminopeptidase/acylaminoacyl peptidase